MRISSIIKDTILYNKIFPFNHHNFQTINPIDNKFIKKFDFDSVKEIKDKIALSHNAYLKWRKKGLENRLEKFKNLSANLEKHKVDLACLITLEMVLIISLLL